NNGMVVAAWSDSGSRHVFVATRPSGGSWSDATRITSDTGVLAMTKDGDGAWLAWQGSEHVSAAPIASDGDVGAPEVVGLSSHSFPVALQVAAGTNGAVAVGWQPKADDQSMLAYRTGGYWQPAEEMPPGTLEGLVVDFEGTVQAVLSTGDVNHGTLWYQRRASDGTWEAPFIISSDASRTSVTGNAEGDIVVGWQNRGGK